MNARIASAIVRRRRVLVIMLQWAVVVLSNWTAFILRFDGRPPDWAVDTFRYTWPTLLLLRAVAFVPFRLYDGLWRYTSIWDLRNIVLAVASSTAVFAALMLSPIGPRVYPRSVFLVDALLLVTMLGGLRLARRVYRELTTSDRGRRVLVYGAGDAGEMIVREMRHNAFYGYSPVGFIDDDAAKKGMRIHGVPVLGTREELPEILARVRPHEILLAMPRTDAPAIRGILSALEPFKIGIKTLPNLSDILDGRVTVSQIRSLETEDLLNRAPVGLDTTPVRALIAGKRVMVTGAGGSIGSELCRQIAAFKPACLVLYERYENTLFAIENDLTDRKLGRGAIAEIGDVTDASRLDQVFTRYRPEIVFHAAAHKHVPLMEQSPCEAVKNNVGGTRTLAEMADRHAVDRFIFISTDKAVNPTSVMGASKRVAELLVQAQAQGSGTSFFTVRFGNVLGSNGSVVPRFLDQIRAGGPVTVTHPEMRRFFMLIPEAVQLVLHAAARGAAAATYVLEMGEQVKVVDMARNLIRLSGHVPDEEIAIEYIGLRPGEKLFEELIGEDEVVVPSAMEKVMQVRSRRVPTPESLRGAVSRLEALAWEGRREEVLRQLATLLPEYAPNVAGQRPERVLAYVSTEPEAEGEAEAGHADYEQVCPACRGQCVRRSRTRSIGERVRKTMTHERLFRCHDCGWRGWMPVPDLIQAPPPAGAPAAAPNLDALDDSLEREEASTVPGFSPRDLK